MVNRMFRHNKSRQQINHDVQPSNKRVAFSENNGKRIAHVPQKLPVRTVVQKVQKKKQDCYCDADVQFEDFVPCYLETAKVVLSPTTYASYKRIISRLIIPFFGGLRLKEVTPAHVQKFVNSLSSMQKKSQEKESDGQKTLSAATVSRYLVILRSIFRLAVKLDYIDDSPAGSAHVSVPKVKEVRVDIFTREEASEMLQRLEQEDLQFQTLIQLAVFTGARRGELVGLKFSDIDFANRKITIERSAYKVAGQPPAVKPPKDYQIRSVTINKSCCELLELLRQKKGEERRQLGDMWKGDDWVFTQHNGQMMNPMTPTKQFSKFLKKHGLKHRKFHSLRHTSATLLLYAGIDIRNVQGRLGHGDIETTNKYLHLIDEADAAAADRLDSMLLPTQAGGKQS